MGSITCTKRLACLASVLYCLQASRAEESEEEPFDADLGEISIGEFLAEYRNKRSKVREINGLHTYFPTEDTQLTHEKYTEALSYSVLSLSHDHEDSLLKDKESYALKEILSDVVEFVRLTKQQGRPLMLKDYYLDVFRGRLNKWLVAYQDNGTSLEPPKDLGPHLDQRQDL